MYWVEETTNKLTFNQIIYAFKNNRKVLLFLIELGKLTTQYLQI